MKSAGDASFAFGVTCFEIRPRIDSDAVLEIGLGIRRIDSDEHCRRHGGQIVRHKLFEKIAGEFRELMLELQLHARSKKRGAFEQARDHRIHSVPCQAAEAFGDSGILFGEFLALLVEKPVPVEVLDRPTVHGGR